LEKLETLLALVNSSTVQVQAAGGGLLVTGMPLFTVYGSDSAKQETSTVGVGSSVGIIIWLLLIFRSLRPLLLSSLAIGSGLFAALVVSVLVLGIGVDDAIFFFMADSSGTSSNEDAEARPASTSLAVTLSALTTILAFGLLAANFTEIVHAFGLTVAAGILMALAFSPLVGHKAKESRGNKAAINTKTIGFGTL
jgi:predicted exporter